MSGKHAHQDPCDDVELRLITRLRDRRVAEGLSQTKLAAAAGVSRSTITHMEDGSSRPTLWVLLRVARALDLDLSVELRQATVQED